MLTNKNGFLELIIGPMFAGKSTELLKHIYNLKHINKTILVINHPWNNRYNSSGITTHSGLNYDDCIVTDKLSTILVDSKFFETCDAIVIEEIQFFTDAVENIKNWCDVHKKFVVVAGLSGNYLREPFPVVSNLMSIADNITQLKSLCKKCSDGTCAIFSKKISNIDKNNYKDETGGEELYIAVCRKHYNSLSDSLCDSLT